MAETNKSKKSNNTRKPTKTSRSRSLTETKGSRQSGSKKTSKSGGKANTNTAKSAPEKDRGGDPSRMRHQLMPYILGLIALFLVICFIVSDSTGFIGGFLKNALFGLFSLGAWVVPILLVNAGIFWKRDVAAGSLGYKTVFSIICLVFISVLIHAFSRDSESYSLSLLYQNGINHIGGGVVGGLIGNLLLRGFGFAGTLIFSIALILLFGIFLFGMTPHMFVSYIYEGIRQCRLNFGSQVEAGRIQREAMQIEYEKRRIAARQAALHEREEQLRSRTPNVVRNPASRRKAPNIDLDGFNDDDYRIDNIPDPIQETGKKTKKSKSEPASAEQMSEQSNDIISTAASTESTMRDSIAVDIAENTAKNMAGETSVKADVIDVADSEDEDDNVVISDAPPFDTTRKRDEPQSSSEPMKLGFFRREKVKPLEKTGKQQLDELEEGEIDLSKIFTEPQESELTAKAGPKSGAAAGVNSDSAADIDSDDDIVGDVPTSAELDLVIEKSKLAAAAELPTGEDDPDDTPDASGSPDAASEQHIKPVTPVEYKFPPIPLLSADTNPVNTDMSAEIQQTAVKLVETLRSFNVKTKIIHVSRGPTITRYELQPEVGTKVRSIVNLVDDIALHLATSGVRIEAPIPGKEAVGIEVPNKTSSTVYIRELLEDDGFKNAQSKVITCLGMDVAGNPVYLDIAKMPHILIAGTTGSGKSVCINSMIISMLYKARPDEVKLILIDPKKVELNIYNGIPHLLVPVVSDPKKAAGSLHWAVTEMERRYELIEGAGVRNIKGYNASIANDPDAERLPQIVIIIDELADLMMTAKDDVEESICRIAQKARAAGMHLVIGTQRPSVDVITGLIKANVPSRIAFTTVSQIDSRTIIDTAGAEKLIGRGDMLFSPVGSIKPVRVQGSFVSDEEVDAVTTFVKQNYGVKDYDQSVMDSIEREAQLCQNKKSTTLGDGDEEANDGDPMLKPAIQLAVESGKISTSLIQRRLQLGYGRAAKLIDTMQEMGIVGPPQGSKPREVLISKQDYMEMELRRE